MYNYWGKAAEKETYHLLVYHSLDVAAVGDAWIDRSHLFLNKISDGLRLSERATKEWFLLFLAYHDLGKFDIRFQNLRPDILEKLQGKTTELSYMPRHDQRGYDFWNRVIFRDVIYSVHLSDTDEDDAKELLDVIAKVVFGHHGKPPKYDSDTLYEIPDGLIEYAAKAANMFLSEGSIEEVKALINEDAYDLDDMIRYWRQYSWQLAGLTTLCDWIASGDQSFSFVSDKVPLEEYYNSSVAKANEALDRTGTVSTRLAKENGMSYLFPAYTEPTPLQAFCDSVEIKDGPQLWVLEDVAGAGKTEAALTLASRIIAKGQGSGVFVALPTMATSNAMYERMAKVYSKLYDEGELPTLSLSHGSKHLSETFSKSYRESMMGMTPKRPRGVDEDEGVAHCTYWLADTSKKALLSDVGVGTVDQLLMAGLPVRYQSLRAFGMAQKVLIIDEVHAFDPYMLRLIEGVLEAQALSGGSAILLSATLPYDTRVKFCEAYNKGLGARSTVTPVKEDVFPLVTGVTSDGITEDGVETRPSVAREVAVSLKDDIESTYKVVEDAVRDGLCVCWIRNTVSDVLETFQTLRDERGIKDIDMFHSRFALKDRLDIEKRVLRMFGKGSTKDERSGKVLIASQVVEQSLDLDFDVMISDLAPIDLLIQRAGRLHRHQRGGRPDPVFYVHTPKETGDPGPAWYRASFPSASFVYKDPAILWNTKEILRTQGMLKMPGEARLLIESVYGSLAKPAPKVFDSQSNDAFADTLRDKSIAYDYILKFNHGYSRDSSEHDMWDKDERATTRLSDPTSKVYICTWDGDKIKPLHDGQKFAWDLSSLTIRSSSLAGFLYPVDITEALVDLVKDNKRFGEHDLFVIFSREGEIIPGLNENNKPVYVSYSRSDGLIMRKKLD